MQRGTVGRFTLLGTLYFAQGLPFGFFALTMPLVLRAAHWSLAAIAFTYLLSAPWALKPLWAGFVDRYYSPRIGRRRTWILAMQAAATLVLGGMAAIPGSENIAVMLAVFLVLNTIAATQDIATDGLAVDLLPPEERGVANGIQVAGYRIGMIVGGGFLLAAKETLGHHGLFGVMCGLTVLSSVPVLLSREPVAESHDAEPRPGKPDVHFLKLDGAWKLIALILLYKFGEEFGKAMLKLYLKDGGHTDKQIGLMIGTVGSIAGMVGAFVGGAFVGLLGRKRALIVFGIGQVITVAGYTYLALTSPSLVELYIWSGVEHLASGCATVALFTSMMDWSRPAYGGADYSTQAAAQVLAVGVAAVGSGASAQLLGYAGHFALATGLCIAAVVGVYALYPRSPFPGPQLPRAVVT